MSQPDLSQNNFVPARPQFNIDMSAVNAVSRQMSEKTERENQAIESTNFLAEFQRSNLASEFAEKLLSRINRFDSGLDGEHEVGVKLVSFGQSVTFHVSNVGYFNPSLILFVGLTEDGNQVELMQHVSQISFLLIALPKLEPDQPKRPIGFIQESI